ncbi:uncharacterized protein LTR77_009691 [Saxophila tyrrhenica]|uniref:Heterokaryon incompatibility domain-containing protein n=1 Tax=Saxophila tyrrhenica TaxID=1690608 RepID=A0AAV9NXJ8_9PEZI|nr:hypothetical protein LTR77_009691 [Saxophila tyrrhenica]
MRLINIHTLELREFTGQPPPYIILSHRWTSNEPTYKQFRKRNPEQEEEKDGKEKGKAEGNTLTDNRKIEDFCVFVQEQQFRQTSHNILRTYNDIDAGTLVQWVWVDTVCIDKRSSAELSEAINSMWQWYARADRCIVYLSDVESTAGKGRFSKTRPKRADLDQWIQFELSAWFTRGWTLQELLAPRSVTFCDQHWSIIGALLNFHPSQFRHIGLAQHVSSASGIEQRYLPGSYSAKTVQGACVAEKFNWAARRRTTRPEDMAYCLLRLLDINMPLLYGEGSQKAFLRLQHEIIRQSDDESIFAWQISARPNQPFGLLAPDVSWFERTRKAEKIVGRDTDYQSRPPYAVTNKGILLETLAFKVTRSRFHEDISGRMESLVFHFAALDPEDPDGPDDLVYMIKLNCRSATRHSRFEKTESCNIILRGGRDNRVWRVIANTLHPDVRVVKDDSIQARFMIKPTSDWPEY